VRCIASFVHDDHLFKWYGSLGVASSTGHFEMRPGQKSRYSLHIMETLYINYQLDALIIIYS